MYKRFVILNKDYVNKEESIVSLNDDKVAVVSTFKKPKGKLIGVLDDKYEIYSEDNITIDFINDTYKHLDNRIAVRYAWHDGVSTGEEYVIRQLGSNEVLGRFSKVETPTFNINKVLRNINWPLSYPSHCEMMPNGDLIVSKSHAAMLVGYHGKVIFAIEEVYGWKLHLKSI